MTQQSKRLREKVEEKEQPAVEEERKNISEGAGEEQWQGEGEEKRWEDIRKGEKNVKMVLHKVPVRKHRLVNAVSPYKGSMCSEVF